MKNLKDIITERLHITKQTKAQTYNYFPETIDELRKILKERLAKDKNADLTDIDTSKITDMSYLFTGLYPSNIDISNWDVSNVENMYCMFWGCDDFNPDLSKWDVGKVKNMRYMFFDCRKFKGKGLEKWNVSKVKDMSNMFGRCTSLKNIPNWYKK